MKKNINVLFLLIILFVLGCKKKEDDSNIDPYTPPQSNNSVDNSAYGFFQIQTMKAYDNNILMYTDTSVAVKMFNSATINTDSTLNVYSGKITYNGDSLASNQYAYYNQINNLNITNCNWSVLGAINTPSFSYSYSPSLPQYNSISLITDSFSVSNNLSLNLAGGSGYMKIRVIIESGETFVDTVFNSISLIIPQNKISSIIQSTDTCNIHVIFFNYQDYSVSNKKYRFVNAQENIKLNVKVKP